jgi:quinohemoprotein ethanol dehydrogenase
MFSRLRNSLGHLLVLPVVLLCVYAGVANARAIDNAALSDNADGTDWPGYGRSFNQQRFSPLAQINTTNVRRLGLVSSLDVDAWNLSTVPLEAGGVIYFAVGYSLVYAVDAVSGKLLWRYDPKVIGPKMRLAWGIRGLALWNDKVYVGTQDGRLIALRAGNGSLVWQNQTTELNDLRYITGAPLVYSGKVLIGHGGADYGPTRGYVTAYDAETGKQLWRFYTVPGDPSKGFENKAMEMAAKTWTGEWWKLGGGGTVWNAMTYDPELNLIYLGTGNGAPWNPRLRSPGGGDNLFLCSIVALDAATGEYRWHYQTTPREGWDFNSAMDMVLTTQLLDGKPRKLLLHAPKSGFFYVLDRETGKLVSAQKFAKVTWADRVDPNTGRPVVNPAAQYNNSDVLMWPGSFGAHAWQPMSFSPDTGLVYLPGRDLPGYYNDIGVDPKTWTFAQGPQGLKMKVEDLPPHTGQGWLVAWDPLRQKQAWRIILPGVSNGGTIATRGGLVFQPNAGGAFVAFDAQTGKQLWSFDMHVGSQATPITFSVKGKQYVSVLAGYSGQPNMYGTLAAQLGWAGRGHPRRLLTFALDGNAKLPADPPPAQIIPITDPDFKLDEAKVARGAMVYMNCMLCHGPKAIAGGYAPDLRASPVVASAPAFRSIVQGGALESRGMPKFGELSDEDVDSVRHYIRSQARELAQAGHAPAAN